MPSSRGVLAKNGDLLGRTPPASPPSSDRALCPYGTEPLAANSQTITCEGTLPHAFGSQGSERISGGLQTSPCRWGQQLQRLVVGGRRMTPGRPAAAEPTPSPQACALRARTSIPAGSHPRRPSPALRGPHLRRDDHRLAQPGGVHGIKLSTRTVRPSPPPSSSG
jgi:hypothetical protein